MIGRETRLCPDLLGVGEDKKEFLIFDFCNNFEFFRMNPKGFEGSGSETLTEKLFNIKINIVKELQDLKYVDTEYMDLRKITGLDRKAAMEEFSEFLNNKNLNSSQVHFIRLIADYVVKNGLIDDNRILTEDPFRTVGNIIELFRDDIDVRTKLLGKIKEIKENALEVI